jgi:hypothetical protein
LWRNAPEHWEAFRHKPHAERVRTISRLTASVVLVVGSSGAGAVKVANWGGKLGHLAVPLFSVTGEGALALRLVAVPVGQAVAVTGQALSATYVLHMAASGLSGWKPPTGGPGQWVQETEYMSDTSRRYQSQVTGSPEGWVYRVRKNGKEVDFDGYQEGYLLDAKGFNYDKWFDANLKHKQFYQGAQKWWMTPSGNSRSPRGRPFAGTWRSLEWSKSSKSSFKKRALKVRRGLHLFCACAVRRPMTASYYAGAYWPRRQESAEECARRAETFFRLLSRCDPMFERWFKQASSLKKALQLQFEPTFETFVRFFSSKKHQLVEGFSLGAWTGHPEDGRSGVLSLTCGTDCDAFPNSCLLYLPWTGPEAERCPDGARPDPGTPGPGCRLGARLGRHPSR